MPRYWLVKEEPRSNAFEQFLEDGSTTWDGVRNYEARNHLQAMRPGDLVLYYHSGTVRAVVGTAEVAACPGRIQPRRMSAGWRWTWPPGARSPSRSR